MLLYNSQYVIIQYRCDSPPDISYNALFFVILFIQLSSEKLPMTNEHTVQARTFFSRGHTDTGDTVALDIRFFMT